MAKKRKDRGSVHTEWAPLWLLEDPVFLAGGFAIPSEFTAQTEGPDGTAVDVDIQIDQRPRAVARKVSVTAGGPGGVLWTTMSRVPIRDIVGTACLTALHRGQPTKDGKTTWHQVGPADTAASERVRQVVQELVGYRPQTLEVRP